MLLYFASLYFFFTLVCFTLPTPPCPTLLYFTLPHFALCSSILFDPTPYPTLLHLVRFTILRFTLRRTRNGFETTKNKFIKSLRKLMRKRKIIDILWILRFSSGAQRGTTYMYSRNCFALGASLCPHTSPSKTNVFVYNHTGYIFDDESADPIN